MNRKILRVLIFMTMLAPIVGCGQSNLLDMDKKWIKELNLDSELIKELRKYTDSSFRVASGNIDAELGYKDAMNYKKFLEKNVIGVSFDATEDMAFKLISNLREKFREKGYFIYISEMNSGYSPEEVTILKTNDKFDLLRFEGTNGVNYDIYTEDIIARLTDWDKKFGLDIFATGFDAVQTYYINRPPDLEEFTKELYEFCPDIVDQGAGTLDELKLVVARTKQIYLWWD